MLLLLVLQFNEDWQNTGIMGAQTERVILAFDVKTCIFLFQS